MDRKIKSFFILMVVPALSWAAPTFPIANTGREFPVNYESYGEFTGIGTNDFKYKITDRAGLAKAMGEGLYPNNGMSLDADPAYQKWKKTKKIPNANPWDFVSTGDNQSEFYVWAHTSMAGPGTKLFFMAQALDEAGHHAHAVKAYYAVLVNFPKEPCWSADKSFVWYLGGEALSRIEGITKLHPELGYRLRGASFKVINGDDVDLNNDEFVLNPGKWAKTGQAVVQSVGSLKVINQRGYGKVKLVQFENKHWQLQVNEKPMVVHGVTYSPTTVGKDLAGSQGNSWMFNDEDHNGRADTPFDAWVDANGNNKKDANEAAVGDFKLLKNMGANAIRIYRLSPGIEYNPKEFNKSVLRKLNKDYGISVIMGDFVGAYTVGSGASWEDGTDYTDPVQLERMKRQIRDYVNDHKAEPYVLMWTLGNENLMQGDYSGVNATRTNAGKEVKAYLSFINEVAKMIHQIDPDHPVMVGNIGLAALEEHAEYAPEVDIFGSNAYKGAQGFGDLFKKVKEAFDRPVIITEYGCDSYNSRTKKEDEAMQATYHKGNWNDIQLNLAGGSEEGNAIGGIIFEYLDEWWKSRDGGWDIHDDYDDSPMAFPDGWSSEEFLGVVSQGNGTQSPFLRKLKKSYLIYRDQLWKAKS